MFLTEKFSALATDNAPGQESRQSPMVLRSPMRGEMLLGVPVDFSHGDVDAFPPIPGSDRWWQNGFESGGSQAYTEYRGAMPIREHLAENLAAFTGQPIIPESELIITPGTQGALFLAMSATVTTQTKVAVIEPDYFANRKLVNFLGGDLIPVQLNYLGLPPERGPNLNQLEDAFKAGAEVLVFSNPNNPTGHVYSSSDIEAIAAMAQRFHATVIVDQLYSRLLYGGESFTHLRACPTRPENLITIMGPSKTESLSGFRLGVAFGSPTLVDRMEKLQAIVSLRAAGYNQAALNSWFNEPEGWMETRIKAHEAIRDDLLNVFLAAGFPTAKPQAGSYLFPQLPPLGIETHAFVKLLRHQAGVTVTPGGEFAPGFDHSVRLNFSQDHNSAVSAARRIVQMVELYHR